MRNENWESESDVIPRSHWKGEKSVEMKIHKERIRLLTKVNRSVLNNEEKQKSLRLREKQNFWEEIILRLSREIAEYNMRDRRKTEEGEEEQEEGEREEAPD